MNTEGKNPHGQDWDPKVIEISKHGLSCTIVTYGTGESMESRQRWNAAKHMEEHNTMRLTPLHICISIADATANKFNGDWGTVLKDLLSFYGEGKRSMCKRWVLGFVPF